jgi:hypothetical protein
LNFTHQHQSLVYCVPADERDTGFNQSIGELNRSQKQPVKKEPEAGEMNAPAANFPRSGNAKSVPGFKKK